MKLFLSILFCLIYYFFTFNSFTFGISSTKLPDFFKFNFTKRPLNLYIPANGKHAIVNNKTLETIKDGASQIKQNGSGSGHVDSVISVIPKIHQIVNYRIAKPPFAIKNRGSIILLHNSTGKLLLILFAKHYLLYITLKY